MSEFTSETNTANGMRIICRSYLE